jgi:hypothetical protein
MELEAILRDVESGLANDEIMSKHNLSEEQLMDICNAWEKVNQLKNRISENRILEDASTADCKSCRFYERFNLGVEEKEQVENQMQLLRRAILAGAITADEFDQRIRMLVRDFLKKHSKKH